jgi:hypothetical protein
MVSVTLVFAGPRIFSTAWLRVMPCHLGRFPDNPFGSYRLKRYVPLSFGVMSTFGGRSASATGMPSF